MSSPRFWDQLFPDYAAGLTDGAAGGAGIPPVASVVLPTSNDYGIAKDQAIKVSVVSASNAIGLVTISVKFGSTRHEQEIYAGAGLVSGFMAGYQLRSSVSGSGAPGVGYTFNCFRDDSWPKGTPAVFTVRAADVAGNVLL